jgi:hypothetical protein
MNREKLEELADNFATEFIRIHTKFAIDSVPHSALRHMFINFYDAVRELNKPTTPLSERNHPMI